MNVFISIYGKYTPKGVKIRVCIKVIINGLLIKNIQIRLKTSIIIKYFLMKYILPIQRE